MPSLCPFAHNAPFLISPLFNLIFNFFLFHFLICAQMPNISPFFLLTTGSDSYIQLSTLSQIWLTLAIWWHFIILATFCGIIAANKMTMFGQQASSSAINRPFFSFPYPSFFKKMLYCLSSFFHTQLSFSQCVYRFFIYIPLIHPINNLVYSPIYFVTFLSTCTDIFLLISNQFRCN